MQSGKAYRCFGGNIASGFRVGRVSKLQNQHEALYAAYFLLSLPVDPEDGEDIYQHVSCLFFIYKALYPRKLNSSL
jgi:hypothetical protein